MTISESAPVPPDFDAIKGPDLKFFSHTYPKNLRQRYSETALTFRAKLHEWTKQLLLERKLYESSGSESIGSALLSKNLLLPQQITTFSSPFDCIASVLTIEKNNQTEATLIMENPAYSREEGTLGHQEKGVGKTALSLAILDIPGFLDNLPPFQPNHLIEITDFEPTLLAPKNNSYVKVVALDFAYLGVYQEQLMTTPIAGVAGFDGQSDIARSVTRAKTAEIGIKYNRLKPDISRYYTTCAKRVFLQNDVFISLGSVVPLTKIVAINFIDSSEQSALQKRAFFNKQRREVVFSQTQDHGWVALDINENAADIAYSLLRVNPIYHPSPTWAVNPEHHLAAIEVARGLLPKKVAFLYIYPGIYGYTPENAPAIFQAGASLTKQFLTEPLLST